MGCVSSALLNHDDDFTHPLGAAASATIGHHIVSLTSTTYGLLTLDPPLPPPHSSSSSSSASSPAPPMTPPPPHSAFPSPLPQEVINSWELMAGLDADSFRFSPIPFSKIPKTPTPKSSKENANPNRPPRPATLKPLNATVLSRAEKFERICPPNGENKVVIYTTTLRGVRKTFEDCNAVRAAIEGLGVLICERDVSMDRGFREELRELMKGKESSALIPPRVFVKGRYVGGAEEVLRIVEDGCLGEILQGFPKRKGVGVCEGCGGVRFLPCFKCNGSCKMVMVVKEEVNQKQGKNVVVVKCPDCNENGLVLCPICS